jgi:hypothetical protein
MINKRYFSRMAAIGMLGGWLCLSAHAAQVFVRVAPPPPRTERVVVVRPSPRHVWVGGYHRWNGRAYVWTPGRWVVPPRRAAVWVPARWTYVPARHGYVFVEGHWR